MGRAYLLLTTAVSLDSATALFLLVTHICIGLMSTFMVLPQMANLGLGCPTVCGVVVVGAYILSRLSILFG